MSEEDVLVLIAAEPGPLRDSLRVLLTVVPCAMAVDQAGDASSTLQAVDETHPDLVLLDGGMPDAEIAEVVARIKASDPQSKCLVLADDVQQRRQVLAAGADAALVKGTPATALLESIEALVSPVEAQDQHIRTHE